MKREFRPLDLAPGFRLDEVILSWRLKGGREASEQYVVAANSPNQTPHSAANEVKRLDGESYDNNPEVS